MLLRRPLLLAALLSAFAFIVYQLTLAPGVSFIDAGELATDCYTLGIAHPNGYPLFVLVGFLFSHIPLGSIIWRLNEMAALFTALGVGGVFLLANEIFTNWLTYRTASSGNVARTSAAPQKNKARQTPERRTVQFAAFAPEVSIVAAIAAALAAAFSETWWEQSTSIEVYPLHLFLVPLVLLFFLRMLRREDSEAVGRDGYLFAALLGLSFTNHMTTILLAPACLYAFIARYGFGRVSMQRVLRLAPAFIAALLLYLYLPIRSAGSPLMDWGHPADLKLFLKHVTGGQYKIWMFTGHSAGNNWSYFWNTLSGQFSLAVFILAPIGLFTLSRSQKRNGVHLLIFSVLLFFGCLLYAINYDIHDIDSYFLLSYLTIAIWIGAAILYVPILWKRERSPWLWPAIAAAVLATVLISLNYTEVDESGNHMVDDFTRNELLNLPPNAIIFSSAWDFWVSGAFYYQDVEHLRPDVIVIDRALLRDRPWYYEHLMKRAPEVLKRAEPEMTAFLRQLHAFDRDEPYSPEAIANTYREFTTALVERNQDRPIFVAQDIIGEPDDLFAPTFHPVPAGIAYRLVKSDSAAAALAPSQLPKLSWNDNQYRRRNYYTDNARLQEAAPLVAYAQLLADRRAYRESLQWLMLALKFTPDLSAQLDHLPARDRDFAETTNAQFERLQEFRTKLESLQR